MRLEIWICLLLWIAMPILLYVWVPQEKVRDAHIIFLYAQFLMWTVDIIYVQLDLVRFPYREFPYATNMSFTMHYMVYPGVLVFFALCFPERRGWLAKGGYYLLWTLGITWFIYGLDRYTDLVELVVRNLFFRSAVVVLVFVLTRVFYVWYRKGFRSAEGVTDSAV